MGNFNRFYGNAVLCRIEGRTSVLHGQTTAEVPDVVGSMRIILQDDDAIAPPAFAFNKPIMPVPQCRAGANATLEGNIRPLDPRGEFEIFPVAPTFFVFLYIQR